MDQIKIDFSYNQLCLIKLEIKAGLLVGILLMD